MKKTLVIALLLYTTVSGACDNCNIYLGVNPNDFSHMFQIRYHWNSRYGQFNEQGQQILKHGTAHQYANSSVTEYYATYAMRAKIFIQPRLNLVFEVPFRNNYRAVNDVLQADLYGMGDPTILANYRLINTKTNDSSRVRQRLSIMGGIKSPLGEHRAKNHGVLLDPDLQLGTGSFDGLFGLNYYLRWNFFGLNASCNYKVNTQNDAAFKFGDRLNWNLGVFSNFKIKKMKLIPFLGYYFEHSNSDVMDGEKFDNAFSVYYLRASAGLFLGKWNLNGEFLFPTLQCSNNSELREEHRIMFGLSYYISK